MEAERRAGVQIQDAGAGSILPQSIVRRNAPRQPNCDTDSSQLEQANHRAREGTEGEGSQGAGPEGERHIRICVEPRLGSPVHTKELDWEL